MFIRSMFFCIVYLHVVNTLVRLFTVCVLHTLGITSYPPASLMTRSRVLLASGLSRGSPPWCGGNKQQRGSMRIKIPV